MEWDIEYSRIFGGERRTPPASKKVVETLPTEAISAAEAGRELKCPVCLAAFDEGEMANKLPCSHQFHSGCIVPWLQRVNSCPLCRHELPTDDEDYEAYKKHKARAKQREYEIESLHGSIDSKVSSNPPFKMFSSRRHPDLTKRRLDMLPGICYLESIMKNRTVKNQFWD